MGKHLRPRISNLFRFTYFSAARRKKRLKQLHGLLGKNPGNDLHAMIERGCIEDLHTRANSSSFGFVGAVNQPGDARLHERAGAHGARLDRHIDCGSEEAMVAGLPRGLAQGQDFCVRGRIAICDGPISRGGKDAVFQHDDGSNGHFSAQRGGLRLSDGQMHIFKIVHGCDGEEEGIRYSTSITSCSPSFSRVWAECRPTSRQPVARHRFNPS